MKVLHVHPKIGIGGVETYLCRLVGEQVRLGHTVGLVTAGGDFEERITAAGGHLFLIPPRREHLERALEAIVPHGFELVHAHNYKAARFGRRVAESIDARFLMSVHGTRAFWHRLLFRDWSERVVVMSEGDRDNISSFGGISRKRILLSFYGIDTERFRPGLDAGPLRRELGLDTDTPVAACITRFSHEKTRVPMALIESLPLLQDAFPGIVALIIGEGPHLPRLEERAAAVNAALRRQAARVVGPRRDVELCMNLASVLLATANTALEGVMCGTPTIAAGRVGYFGPVTPDNFESARATCFADHGRPLPAVTARLVAGEVRGCLTDLPAARQSAERLHRQVASRYDVPRMAEDIEAIYGLVMQNGAAGRGEHA